MVASPDDLRNDPQCQNGEDRNKPAPKRLAEIAPVERSDENIRLLFERPVEVDLREEFGCSDRISEGIVVVGDPDIFIVERLDSGGEAPAGGLDKPMFRGSGPEIVR